MGESQPLLKTMRPAAAPNTGLRIVRTVFDSGDDDFFLT
jgi:hypothetical protein